MAKANGPVRVDNTDPGASARHRAFESDRPVVLRSDRRSGGSAAYAASTRRKAGLIFAASGRRTTTDATGINYCAGGSKKRTPGRRPEAEQSNGSGATFAGRTPFAG